MLRIRIEVEVEAEGRGPGPVEILLTQETPDTPPPILVEGREDGDWLDSMLQPLQRVIDERAKQKEQEAAQSE
jgi:hypothetical protein